MRPGRFVGLFAALVLAGNASPQGVITTFAGGNWVFNGNGQPAVNAPLGFILGVTIDPSGNVVLADSQNYMAARINPDGTLAVIAGNTIYDPTHTGDGGPAVDAIINSNGGVAYDSQRNLYILETDRISRVSPQGIINTFAGGGLDATSEGIPALQAAISPRLGLVVDASGVIYYSDPSRNRVRKVTPDGTITTVAGTGVAGFSGDGGPAKAAGLNSPEGLALDRSGNLLIADNGNSRVRRVSPAGIISTVINSFPANGLAVENNGTLYLAGEGAIYKVAPDFSAATQIAGTPPSAGYIGGFSGDGGPALGAQFSVFLTVAVDNLGNIFVGDTNNRRVRRIATNGIVTTIAGNGNFYYSGEGVPALVSPVEGFGNLAVDHAGSVYYSDPSGARVRKVTAGIINTVAGSGIGGYSGDGGPALEATLFNPRNLAFDAANDLYIADSGNQRVRKVGPDGKISTYAQLPGLVWGLAFDAAGNLYASLPYQGEVYRIDPQGRQTVFAGTGVNGYSGDGGPANLAKLNGPAGLAFDSHGYLYIADSRNGSVRVVSPQGLIGTFVSGGAEPTELAFDPAGNLYVSDEAAGLVYGVTPSVSVSIAAGGGELFPGDGKPATSALLINSGIACDGAGNLYIDDGPHGIEVVLAKPPTISLQQSSLSLSAASGGAPVTQPVTVLGSVPSLDFNVSVTTAGGGTWLNTDATSASTPDLLSVTANPSKLAPGTYTGTVTIAPVVATPASLKVTVTFTVGAALPPQLSVDQPNLSFTYPKGAPARSAKLKLLNAGGGALNFTVTATTKTGGSWLTATPGSGTASPGSPVTVIVTADPSRLTQPDSLGNYTGTVSIQSSGGGSTTIPVNMALSGLTQALLLTQTGMSFTAVAQGGVVPPQSFGLVNLGTGSLAWTASASTLAGGNWLNVTPANGSSDPALGAPQVTVSVDAAGLAAGDYYGLVHIAAPGAANTPQAVSVFLTVLPAGSDPGASVQPTELFFTADPNGESPGSQQVFLYNIGAASKSFYGGFPVAEFGIVVLPAIGAIDPSQPTRVLVDPTDSFIFSGYFTDVVSFQFSDGRVQTVKVHVIAGAASPGAAGHLKPHDAACAPTTLIPALTTLSPSFSVSAGWPVALSVNVVDDCGNPHVSGSVSVTFSNGDPSLSLNSLNNGTWQATWPTTQGTAGQPVAMTITAVNTQLQISGTREVDGTISSAKDPPAIAQGGVVSAASPVSFTALAPGSMIAIYGLRLADFNDSAPSIPLPTTLGNTRVIIGDQQVPLFYASDGQINAMVPYGLNTNTTHQLLIQRDLTYSRPVPIDVADAQPGIFQSGDNALAFDSRGTAPSFLVTPSAPAQAGDVLVLYCAGLGLALQPVGDGSASPSVPTQASVQVSIGGQNAGVLYSGLVAGLVGLYQVNVTMPGGVSPGNAVPVTITVDGQTSPVANISSQ